MKKKVISQKGITLVALVITVIVLLILAGTAIGIATNGGDVFSKTAEAREQWNEAVQNEENAINSNFDILEEAATGVKSVSDENPGTIEGTGTTSDPYTINSIEDLVGLAYAVNHNDNLYTGKTILIAANLDFNSDKSYVNPNAKYEKTIYGYTPNENGTSIKSLLTDTSGEGFIPISNEESTGFAGAIDGKGHIIYNLYVNTVNCGGLFGNIRDSLTVKDLGFKNTNVNSKAPGGAIVGHVGNNVTIENCYNTGKISISAAWPAGGLAGEVLGTLTATNCYNTGKITVTGNAPAGGIAGVANNSVISNSYNTGTIDAPYPVGGFIGQLNISATMNNCYNTGNIICNNATAGGFFGYIGTATINMDNCYNAGEVNGTNTECGGIYGTGRDADVTITNTYNTGKISTTNYPAGGLLGYTNGTVTITNCYNTGSVDSNGREAGGIIGEAEPSRDNGTTIKVDNCYNTGSVTVTNATAGGIVGVCQGNEVSVTIINCFNEGTITGIPGQYCHAGGILGVSAASDIKIMNCYNNGKINASKLAAGILAYGYTNGNNSAMVANCYNTADIDDGYQEVQSDGSNSASGIIASFTSNITVGGCYNTGNVKSKNLAGGIIAEAATGCSINQCYNSGRIETTGSTYAAGIAASNGTIAQSHNTGDIVGISSSTLGEITGSGTEGSDCTYLSKTSNASATNAVAKSQSQMDQTMAMSAYVTMLNNVVTSYNSYNPNIHLNSWTLSNGLPKYAK